MRYRKLSDDGDYTFGGGQLNFWRDVPEAVGQAVQTRLLLWLGEWFLNIDEGTPYMIGILGKHSKEVADITIQDRILGTQGMVDISQYDSTVSPENRDMIVAASIDTVYGPTDVQVQNYTNY